ncbi:hypothetical protein [Nocardia wallacei]|uniref:hypothetical protein n=1 Tax=Nocardia wallacei TaxID=480035 RepID=UPI002454C3B1|nr:hypothetical protein [Nocardia wallacei]
MHSLAIHQLNTLIDQETHHASNTPFTVPQAHTITQFHIACRVRPCLERQRRCGHSPRPTP